MRTRSEEKRDLLIVLGTVAGVVAVAALLLTWSWPFSAAGDFVFGGGGTIDCDDYSFDRGAWERASTADEEAAGLSKCGVLLGKTKREVADFLGGRPPRGSKARLWNYGAGEVNDFLGPGDGQAMHVRFNSDGIVTGVDLTYPPD